MAKIKGAVVVDTERCKGCDLCVIACPSKVLALATDLNSKGYNYSHMAHPDDCVGCAASCRRRDSEKAPAPTPVQPEQDDLPVTLALVGNIYIRVSLRKTSVTLPTLRERR